MLSVSALKFFNYDSNDFSEKLDKFLRKKTAQNDLMSFS